MKKIILAIALLLPVQASAQITGIQLEGACKDDGGAGYLSCISYFAGFKDATSVWDGLSEEVGSGLPLKFCADGVHRDILVRTWLKFVEENPEKLAMPPKWSVLESLLDGFPCEGES